MADAEIDVQIPGYEILRVLGAGTSTKSYLALDKKGNHVVVKRLMDRLASQPRVAHKFLAVNDQSSRIRMKRHVATVSGQRSSADGIYLVRQFVEGRSLAACILKGFLKHLDAHRLARDIGEAIRAMNTRGVVHGGLHPGNVIVTTDRRAIVTDFGCGLAQLCQGIQKPYPLDALRYLAPEQWLGKQGDERADVYSAALVIALLKNGRHAFDANDGNRLEAQIRTGHVDSTAAITKAVNKSAEMRYPNIDAFNKELRAEWKPAKSTPDRPPAPTRDSKAAPNTPTKSPPAQEPPRKAKARPKSKAKSQSTEPSKARPTPDPPQPPEPKPVVEPDAKPEFETDEHPELAVRDVLSRAEVTAQSPSVFVPAASTRQQRPLRLTNVGRGILDLTLSSHGSGIDVNPTHLVIPPGRANSVTVTLDPNSDRITKLACRWWEDGIEEKLIVHFIRK